MLNYQSLLPYEKNLRDKSPIPEGKDKRTRPSSFIKSQKRPKSTINKTEE